MSNLIPASSTNIQLSPRGQRTVGRQLATIQTRTAVDLAVIDAAAQRWEAAAQGVTSVVGCALQHVALVSQAEQQLAQTVPHASGRLAAVGDAHGLAMQSIVMGATRALGRLA